MAYEAGDAIDTIVVRNCAEWHHISRLYYLQQEIGLIRTQVTKIYENMTCDARAPNVAQTSRPMMPHVSSAPTVDEVTVGLNDQEEAIINRLTRGSLQRDIVSIVGMARIGKTTLAKKVYNNPKVTYHFHIRAWCSVCHEYNKRELLLEMSYNHLPEFLKPCCLYLRAFMKDNEIPVWKLIRLWITEGFIQGTERVSLEDAAEEYLMDLIHRSLVIVARRRSNGGVKACSVHDLLRDLERCKEENFLHRINGYSDIFAWSSDGLDYGVDSNYSYPLNANRHEEYRLSISSKQKHFIMAGPSGPHTHSLLFFATTDMYPRCPYDISFISQNFELLRVLDLECINMGHFFPDAIAFMVHLRYLAVSGDIDSIPSSIANLWNLETFLVKGLKGKVVIPCSIWSLGSLRHVHVNNVAAYSLEDNKLESSSQSHNLITLSSPSLTYGENTDKILRKFPLVRNLRCIFLESWDDSGKYNRFPVLNVLAELEALKIFYYGRICCPTKCDFPSNLKKLTLSNFRLSWDFISEIGRLPNLEVLKLLSRAFEGKTWSMREGEFKELKFLKFDTLNICHWNASSDHLPKLERLVLQNCKQLEAVPSSFEEISTLQMIEVQLCGHSVEDSARRLVEEQLDLGIEGLKVLINVLDWDFRASS